MQFTLIVPTRVETALTGFVGAGAIAGAESQRAACLRAYDHSGLEERN